MNQEMRELLVQWEEEISWHVHIAHGTCMAADPVNGVGFFLTSETKLLRQAARRLEIFLFLMQPTLPPTSYFVPDP